MAPSRLSVDHRLYGTMGAEPAVRGASQGHLVLVSREDVEPRDLLHVRNELIKLPNMNKTGRLPGISMLHLHMRIRITATICPRLAPVDTTGTIVNIELEAPDRIRMEQGAAPCILLL